MTLFLYYMQSVSECTIINTTTAGKEALSYPHPPPPRFVVVVVVVAVCCCCCCFCCCCRLLLLLLLSLSLLLLLCCCIFQQLRRPLSLLYYAAIAPICAIQIKLTRPDPTLPKLFFFFNNFGTLSLPSAFSKKRASKTDRSYV